MMLRYPKFSELPVVDQDRAIGFYTEKVGLKVFVDTPYSGAWRWLEFAIDGAQTKILVTRREGKPREEPAIVFVVDDVEKEYARLKELGVEFTQTPAKAPWSAEETYALFRDSEGNIVMLGSA